MQAHEKHKTLKEREGWRRRWVGFRNVSVLSSL